MEPENHILLELQDADLKIEQLKHQLENPPEAEKLQGLEAQIAEIKGELEKLSDQIKAIKKNQKRLEDEVASSAQIKESYQNKIDSGTITASKELQDLEKAIETRKEQELKLEDEILDLMEEAEPLEMQSSATGEKLTFLEQEYIKITKNIASATKTLEGEIDELKTVRQNLDASVPKTTLETYDKLRKHHNGIGVARLVENKCQGCDLNMAHPASEIERILAVPEGELPLCGECQRILVIIPSEESSD